MRMYILSARNVIAGYTTIGEFKDREQVWAEAKKLAADPLCDEVTIVERIERIVVQLDGDCNTIYTAREMW